MRPDPPIKLASQSLCNPTISKLYLNLYTILDGLLTRVLVPHALAFRTEQVLHELGQRTSGERLLVVDSIESVNPVS
jgi:hypothetical protein